MQSQQRFLYPMLGFSVYSGRQVRVGKPLGYIIFLKSQSSHGPAIKQLNLKSDTKNVLILNPVQLYFAVIKLSISPRRGLCQFLWLLYQTTKSV